MNEKNYVVVTTDKDRKGVFFGELKEHNKDKATVILENAKMCVYWNVETKGVLGLANPGPQKGCKLTPFVPEIYLDGVTAVMKCSERAVEQWRKEIWG